MFNELYYFDYYSTTRALIGQNQSRDGKVSLLRGRLSVHSALSRCVIGSLGNVMFKLHKIYIIFVVNIKFPRQSITR